MKTLRVIAVAALVLGAGELRAQSATTAAWEFQGIGIAADPDCIGQVLTGWEYKFLRKDAATFDEDKRSFRDSVSKAKNGKSVVVPITIRGDKDVVIAVVKKQTLCMTAAGKPKLVDAYEYVHGPTPQAIMQQLKVRQQIVEPMQDKEMTIIEYIKIQIKESVTRGGKEPVYSTEQVAIGVRG